MIINNPQDLTPLLTAMREGLQADMNTLTDSVQAANNALSHRVSTEIDALMVVNGEIKTDVQAINAHTTEQVNALTIDVIKNVYRISASASGNVDIPAVVMNKTQVNVLTTVMMGKSSGGTTYRSSGAMLKSETQVFIGTMTGTTINVEVIEYA